MQNNEQQTAVNCEMRNESEKSRERERERERINWYKLYARHGCTVVY